MLRSVAYSSLSTALRKQKSKTVSVSLLWKGFPGQTVSVFLEAEGWIPEAYGRARNGSAPPAIHIGGYPGSAPALCALGFTGVQQRCTRGRGTHLGCSDLIQGYGQGTVWTWPGELLWEAGIQEHLSVRWSSTGLCTGWKRSLQTLGLLR